TIARTALTSTADSIATAPITESSAPIIIGVIISILAIIIVISIVVFCLKKRENKVQEGFLLEDLPPQLPGMGSRYGSEISLYSVVLDTAELQIPTVPSRGSRHESENSLYGAIVVRDTSAWFTGSQDNRVGAEHLKTKMWE
ncbi:unnamed protein product, partial [Meganyctiphanes norvegica]